MRRAGAKGAGAKGAGAPGAAGRSSGAWGGAGRAWADLGRAALVSPAALSTAAAILLGIACTVWAAVPTPNGGGATFVLFALVVCVTGGGLRLALAGVPLPEDAFMLATPMRLWLNFLRFLRTPPWEEGAVIAALWLEVMHRSRPWHTAVLGAALVAYLITVHLAESGAVPRVLRPQVPVLAIGACLLALGAGASMLPVVTPGPGSALLRVIAALAVVLAAALVLPHVTTRR
jgi:hypothetical protein